MIIIIRITLFKYISNNFSDTKANTKIKTDTVLQDYCVGILIKYNIPGRYSF